MRSPRRPTNSSGDAPRNVEPPRRSAKMVALGKRSRRARSTRVTSMGEAAPAQMRRASTCLRSRPAAIARSTSRTLSSHQPWPGSSCSCRRAPPGAGASGAGPPGAGAQGDLGQGRGRGDIPRRDDLATGRSSPTRGAPARRTGRPKRRAASRAKPSRRAARHPRRRSPRPRTAPRGGPGRRRPRHDDRRGDGVIDGPAPPARRLGKAVGAGQLDRRRRAERQQPKVLRGLFPVESVAACRGEGVEQVGQRGRLRRHDERAVVGARPPRDSGARSAESGDRVAAGEADMRRSESRPKPTGGSVFMVGNGGRGRKGLAWIRARPAGPGSRPDSGAPARRRPGRRPSPRGSRRSAPRPGAARRAGPPSRRPPPGPAER